MFLLKINLSIESESQKTSRVFL